MSLLAPVASHFGDSHAGDLNPCERLFQIVNLVRPNDGFDEFHASSDRSAGA
jgi:hypothetical protein